MFFSTSNLKTAVSIEAGKTAVEAGNRSREKDPEFGLGHVRGGFWLSVVLSSAHPSTWRKWLSSDPVTVPSMSVQGCHQKWPSAPAPFKLGSKDVTDS